MSSNLAVAEILNRGWFSIERKRDQYREWWIVQVKEDGYQGHWISEIGQSLEEACEALVARLQEARDAG